MSAVHSVTHKLMIINTPLRSCIPPQACKMTPKMRQICGCEIFIIPKYMPIDLNISITRLVSYLQHNYVGRHKHNSLFGTISATY